MAANNNKVFARPDPSSDWLTVRVGKRAASRAAAKRLRPLVSPEQTYQMVGRDATKKTPRKPTPKGNEQDAAEASGSKTRRRKDTKTREQQLLQQQAFDACAGLSYLGRHANCFPTPLNHMKLMLHENRVTCVRCHECKASKTPVQCCPYLLYRKPQMQMQIPRSKLSPAIRVGPQWQFLQSPRQDALRHDILPHFCHFVSKARVHKRKHGARTESTTTSLDEGERSSQAGAEQPQRRRTDGDATGLERVSVRQLDIDVHAPSAGPILLKERDEEENFEDEVVRQLTEAVRLPTGVDSVPIGLELRKSRTIIPVEQIDDDVDNVPSEGEVDLTVKYERIAISPEQLDSLPGPIVEKTASEIEEHRLAGHTASGHLLIRQQSATDRRRSMHERSAESAEWERQASDAEELMKARTVEGATPEARVDDPNARKPADAISRSKQSLNGADMMSESHADAVAKGDDDDARLEEDGAQMEYDVGDIDLRTGDAGDVDVGTGDVEEEEVDVHTGVVQDVDAPITDVGDIETSIADIGYGDLYKDDVRDDDVYKADVGDADVSAPDVEVADVPTGDKSEGEIYQTVVGEGDVYQAGADEVTVVEANMDDSTYDEGRMVEPSDIIIDMGGETVEMETTENDQLAPKADEEADLSETALDVVTDVKQEDEEVASEVIAETEVEAEGAPATNTEDVEAGIVDEPAETTELIADETVQEAAIESTEQGETAGVNKTESIDEIGAIDRMEYTQVADVEAAAKSAFGNVDDELAAEAIDQSLEAKNVTDFTEVDVVDESENVEAVETTNIGEEEIPEEIVAGETLARISEVSDAAERTDKALDTGSESFHPITSDVLETTDANEDEAKSNDDLTADDETESEYDMEEDA